MNVFLTFDIEVWCNGWNDLDRAFPNSFARYVYGESSHGAYALPQTLSILNEHGLKGIFFVEPLFATRFGTQYLETIVKLIREAGHEIQLHLHPEWTDEAIIPILENCLVKRQHMSYYTLDEQTKLIAVGKMMLEAAGSGPITAFRSGSYAANGDTFEALYRNQIFLDFSLNRCFAISAPNLRTRSMFDAAFAIGGVTTYPVTIIEDGFGKDRPAQVSACSLAELRNALRSAEASSTNDFVVVSHNFEMLKTGSSQPDWVVVKRFRGLCAYLAKHPIKYNVRGCDPGMQDLPTNNRQPCQPKSGRVATAWRYVEQVKRRLF